MSAFSSAMNLCRYPLYIWNKICFTNVNICPRMIAEEKNDRFPWRKGKYNYIFVKPQETNNPKYRVTKLLWTFTLNVIGISVYIKVIMIDEDVQSTKSAHIQCDTISKPST